MSHIFFKLNEFMLSEVKPRLNQQKIARIFSHLKSLTTLNKQMYKLSIFFNVLNFLLINVFICSRPRFSSRIGLVNSSFLYLFYGLYLVNTFLKAFILGFLVQIDENITIKDLKIKLIRLYKSRVYNVNLRVGITCVVINFVHLVFSVCTI